jgi:biopolymer transport protein TolR
MPKIQQHTGSGGGRRGRMRHVASSLSEINVVPLVDVMLVLLIIFMVTAPMMQQGLQVNLPTSRRATSVSAQPIYVTVPSDFSRTRIVQLDTESMRIDVLQERVRQAVLSRDDKSVFIRADADGRVQDIITVMDMLKGAGVERVGIMTTLPVK